HPAASGRRRPWHGRRVPGRAHLQLCGRHSLLCHHAADGVAYAQSEGKRGKKHSLITSQKPEHQNGVRLPLLSLIPFPISLQIYSTTLYFRYFPPQKSSSFPSFLSCLITAYACDGEIFSNSTISCFVIIPSCALASFITSSGYLIRSISV